MEFKKINKQDILDYTKNFKDIDKFKVGAVIVILIICITFINEYSNLGKENKKIKEDINILEQNILLKKQKDIDVIKNDIYNLEDARISLKEKILEYQRSLKNTNDLLEYKNSQLDCEVGNLKEISTSRGLYSIVECKNL